MDINNLLLRGEGPNIDFKETVTNSLGKVIASFSSSGGGIILIGINKEQQVLGIDFKSVDQLWQQVDTERLKVHPTSNCKYKNIVHDGKNLMAIIVKAGIRPVYYYSGKPYIREGTSSRPATPEEVETRVLDFYFNQGLRSMLNELKLLYKMVDQQMFIFELPTDSWRDCIKKANSNEQFSIIERVTDAYQKVLIWNSYGIQISSSHTLNSFDFQSVSDTPVGKFALERKRHLLEPINNAIRILENEIHQPYEFTI